MEVFFGAAPSGEDALEKDGGTRVVVQPDFSVMVLGLNAAPAAELLPFCERVKGRSGPGSLTLRITRDTVIRAVSAGLNGDEILARLKRLASTPVPPNVLTEVRDWSAWVREVSAGPVLLFRCPDASTAERVHAALGKKAERLGDRFIALSEQSVNAALRQKLLSQGIIVAGVISASRTP